MGFNEVKAERIAKAEAMYMASTVTGDKDQQFKAIGELMAYRVITKDDPRFKKFLKDTKENPMFFERDIRNEMYYGCKWVYGDYPSTISTIISTMAHEGKRIEGNYEGDVHFESRDMQLKLTEIKSTATIRRIDAELVKIYTKNTGRKMTLGASLSDKIEAGEVLVYKIETPDNFIKKNFGYVAITKSQKNNTVKATIFLHRENISAVYLNYKRTIQAIKGMLEYDFRNQNGFDIIFGVV